MSLIERNPKGVLREVSKELLNIDKYYQRVEIEQKSKKIGKDFLWIACGALSVSLRDGVYYVIDGQHRLVGALIAAQNNADITTIPCLVFEGLSQEEEAESFITINKNRKAPSGIDTFNAYVASKDQTAVFVKQLFSDLDIKIARTARGAKQIKCMGFVMRAAKENKVQFRKAMEIASKLCDRDFISEELSSGIFYLCKKGIMDERMRKRIIAIGRDSLVLAAKRAVVFRGGKRVEVWAEGMLNEINKGLRNKYKFNT